MFRELRDQLATFIERLSHAKFEEPLRDNKVRLCVEMLKAIYNDPVLYDSSSPMSQKHVGHEFSSIVNLVQPDHIKEKVDDLICILARIAREKELRSRTFAAGSDAAVIDYFRRPDLSGIEKNEADYILNRIPETMAVELLQRLEHREREIAKSIEGWNQSLEGWGKIIERHEGNLKNIHLRYNFVELSKAFYQMFSSKLTEKRIILGFIILFGVLLIVVPGLLIFGAFVRPTSDQVKLLHELITTHDWAAIAPLLTVEVILLYFFRILLHNYYSAKVQLLELDHKQALCAFIESYAAFARDKKDLSKFEALVFRPLSPDTKNIPSTVDALEQITKIVKDLKAK